MNTETITKKYLDHNFIIPDYSIELNKAEERINTLKNHINALNDNNNINDNIHNHYYDEIITVLFFIGDLSSFIFPIEDTLYERYNLAYKNSPHLGIKLWTDYCESIHKPYSTLKNRCYRLIDILDDLYIKKFNKYPPNWKV